MNGFVYDKGPRNDDHYTVYQNYLTDNFVHIGGSKASIDAGGSVNIATNSFDNSIVGTDLTPTGISSNLPTNTPSNITLPTGNNGLFILNPNLNPTSPTIKNQAQSGVIASQNITQSTPPTYQYLIQTNLPTNMMNQSQFIGSEYFLSRIGYNPNSSVVLLGDPMYQTRFVTDQIQQKLNQKYTESGIGSDLQQVQKLYDNAVFMQQELGLQVGTELSQSQIDNLKSDIIWLVEKEVNGQKILVPEVYLSKLTLANIDKDSKSIVKSGGNLTISSSGDIKNEGTLSSGNNLNLSSNKDILNIGGSIKSKNNTEISAGGNFLNLTQKYTRNQNETAINQAQTQLDSTNITINNLENEAIQKYGYLPKLTGFDGMIMTSKDPELKNLQTLYRQRSNLQNQVNYLNESNNISEVLGSKATVSSGENLNITAGQITNVAASLTAGNNISLTATDGNINIVSESLRNRTAIVNDDWKDIKETVVNQGSEVVSGGNISINSLSDINIQASNISGKGNGNLQSLAGNINILNAIDSKMSYHFETDSDWKSSSLDEIYDYKETNKGSNLDFKNLSIASQNGDLTVVGSELKSSGNTQIDSQNTTIKAAEVKNEHSERHESSSFNPIGMVASLVSIGADLVTFGKFSDWTNNALTKVSGPAYKKTEEKSSQKEMNLSSSNLDSNGNFIANSSQDFTVEASNIKAGTALINAQNINITSKAETSENSYYKKEISLGDTQYKQDLSKLQASVSVKGLGTETEQSSSVSTQKSSNLSFGNLLLNSNNDTTITASNIAVQGNTLIQTGGNLNLLDAKNTVNSSTSFSQLEVELGVKAGNAYVDLGYAYKAVADATKALKQANDKLNTIENLHSQGFASQKAVDLAYAQVTIATTNLGLATTSLALATAGAASAASSSFGTGMYGAAYMSTSGVKSTNSTTQETSVGSSITSSNMNIATAENINLIGSLLGANNLDISAQKITLKQGENYLHTEESTKQIGASASVGNNAVQLNNITLGLTDKDIEEFSFNKSEIVGNNVSISGVVDDSENQMKDYRFVNADFEGSVAIPIQLLSTQGLKQFSESFTNFTKNTEKVFQETIGGVGMLSYGIANGTLPQYGLRAFNEENMDQYSHNKSKEATGNYIGSGLISTLFSSTIEAGQYPYYSLTYLLGIQNKYDPLGVWNENSSRPNPESIGGLTGQSYIQDMQNDVIDMYNGSQGNFNYITNIDEYNKSIK